MKCPKCSSENPDNTRFCCSCDCELAQADPRTERVKVRISKAAIASFVCSFIALACFVPSMIAAIDPIVLNPRSNLVDNVACMSVLAGGGGFILAIAAFGRITGSGGRLAGRGFAVAGAVIPPILVLLLFRHSIGRRGHAPSWRLYCGTNLSGLGKAMLIYSNDYDDKLPVAGGSNSVWAARIPDWKAADQFAAYGIRADGTGGRASVSSSLYLLVKYMEVDPTSFVCREHAGTREFVPRRYGVDDDLTDLWDFGPDPPRHCSYSYHLPFGAHPLAISAEPGVPVAADRNPWIESPFAKARDFTLFVPDVAPFNGKERGARRGNSRAHLGEGQNVLHLDSHVSFEKRPFCGIENDNIFTYWNQDDRIRGAPPVLGSEPVDRADSLLVNDPMPLR